VREGYSVSCRSGFAPLHHSRIQRAPWGTPFGGTGTATKKTRGYGRNRSPLSFFDWIAYRPAYRYFRHKAPSHARLLACEPRILLAVQDCLHIRSFIGTCYTGPLLPGCYLVVLYLSKRELYIVPSLVLPLHNKFISVLPAFRL